MAGYKYFWTCPNCGTSLQLKMRVTQTKRKCPHCGFLVTPEEIDNQAWWRVIGCLAILVVFLGLPLLILFVVPILTDPVNIDAIIGLGGFVGLVILALLVYLFLSYTERRRKETKEIKEVDELSEQLRLSELDRIQENLSQRMKKLRGGLKYDETGILLDTNENQGNFEELQNLEVYDRFRRSPDFQLIKKFVSSGSLYEEEKWEKLKRLMDKKGWRFEENRLYEIIEEESESQQFVDQSQQLVKDIRSVQPFSRDEYIKAFNNLIEPHQNRYIGILGKLLGVPESELDELRREVGGVTSVDDLEEFERSLLNSSQED